MCLHRWVPELSIHEVNFTFCPFWIQMHGVPLEGFSLTNARKIASKVGKVDEVEDPLVGNKIIRGFLRARVYVNIEKPLITSFRIPRKDFPDTWVWIHYEKLQDYCYSCGMLGHNKKDCRKKMAMAPWNPDRPRYGPGLGVPPLKPVSNIIATMSQNRGEGGEPHVQARVSGGKAGRNVEVGKPTMTRDDDLTEANRMEKSEANMAVKETSRANLQPMEHRANQKGKDVTGSTEMMSSGEAVSLKDMMGEKSTTRRGEDVIGLHTGPIEQLTHIDLEEGRVRPGLGPMCIDDLGLEKEDIGLKEPVILTDMLSPERPGRPNTEVNLPICLDMGLSAEEIRRCRQVIGPKTKEGEPVSHAGRAVGEKGKAVVIWQP